MNKRNVTLWGLYDFANSLIQINLLLYLSQWLIVDNGTPEIYYSLVFSFSTVMLVISSPFVGVYANKLSRKLPTLLLLTSMIGLSYLLLGLLAVLPGISKAISVPIIITLGVVVNFLYQTSLVFFNALIPSLGKRSNIGRISGIGEFFNTAGMAAGILITLPFVEGKLHLFGEPGKAQSFLPAGILFVLLTVPFFVLFKERKAAISTSVTAKYLVGRTVKLIKGLPNFPQMMWFLIGFYFVSDAVRTTLLFFPIYLERVWRLGDRQKGVLTIGLIVAMMFGAIIVGNLSDKFGTRKTIVTVVVAMVVVLIAILPFSSFGIGAAIVGGAAGMLWGGYFAVSRSMLVKLSPKGRLAEYLGLYTLFERFASVIAPLVWSGVVVATSQFGPAGSYKSAVFITALIMLLGRFFLRKVKEETE